MLFLALLLVWVVPVLSFGNQSLASKVIRTPLNQNEPAVVKLGTRGITTLEFPYKIEALDGYGFSANPSPDGTDLFQISFNKGTNFLSLKAVRDGVEGNLTVVLDGKVYCFFCTAAADPSYVVVFEDHPVQTVSNPGAVFAKNKEVTPARLLGFLDKVKAYPSLKVSAPEIFRNMKIAEPNSESSLEGLRITLRRVIRDESLDSLGFEVELANQSAQDFRYDPESFAVRIGDEVYPEVLTDAGGLVAAGKTVPAFFVVAGTSTGDRNDLAVTNKFDIVVRQIIGESLAKVLGHGPEPSAADSAARPQDRQEPALPVAENDARVPVELTVSGDRKPPRPRGRRQKSPASTGENHVVQRNKRKSNEAMTGEADEKPGTHYRGGSHRARLFRSGLRASPERRTAEDRSASKGIGGRDGQSH